MGWRLSHHRQGRGRHRLTKPNIRAIWPARLPFCCTTKGRPIARPPLKVSTKSMLCSPSRKAARQGVKAANSGVYTDVNDRICSRRQRRKQKFRLHAGVFAVVAFVDGLRGGRSLVLPFYLRLITFQRWPAPAQAATSSQLRQGSRQCTGRSHKPCTGCAYS